MAPAWNILFQDKTIRGVTRWVRKRGVPRCDVPDLAQTILLESIKSFPRYDPHRSRPERWLNGIALHVLAHDSEKAYRRVEVLVGLRGPNVLDDRANALERLLAEERRLLLHEILTEVPADLASILIEHDLQEHSMQEVAARARLSVSTAYKRRARALAAARALARGL